MELHDILTKSAGASILNFKLDSVPEYYNEQNFGENVNDVVRKLYHSNVSTFYLWIEIQLILKIRL